MNFLFLDTETGGLNPFKHDLLQIGLVAYVDGNIKDQLEISIKKDEYIVTATALKFNGLDLYNDIYKVGLFENKAIERIIDFINKNFAEKPILVGHNPSIDKYMLRELFDKFNLDMDDYISYRMIDTMSLIWGLHFAGKLPIEVCSSDGAFKYFDINVQKRHHALDDCLATVNLYEKLIELIK